MDYLVKSHLKHNGREYFEGDTISLKKKYVEPLVERGVIEPVEEEAEPQDEEVTTEYSEMSWTELQKEASEQGVLKAGMKKQEVIGALEGN